ncbi:MAG TPA: respiratory nitrate reductase subunit gamma [Bacillota bacterium]|nr:respiratory nitrate reductase subunit gamma [Bacillota bacterium]
MLEQFFWVILPYLVLVIFIGGHIYRYQHDQLGWTTKSSEIFEKKKLGIGSNAFHWGIIFVFGGHVLGVLIPEGVYASLRITEEMYHKVALGFGIPAGLLAIFGLFVLMYRRFTDRRVRSQSSTGDFIALICLAIVMLTGMFATFFNINPQGFDYRTTIGPWFRSIFLFQPDASLMETVPLWFKIHIVAAFGIFAVWPFTRLVHVFSLPLKYLRRNYVIFRKYEKNEPKKRVL